MGHFIYRLLTSSLYQGNIILHESVIAWELYLKNFKQLELSNTDVKSWLQNESMLS